MKLFLKGARCAMAKCPIEVGRPAPGMHNQRRSRKMSDYGTQLRVKQRLRRQYGLREGQFRLFFERAASRGGVTGELLLQMLESRLDNIVYRLGMAPSRRSARQMVSHNHVLVNGRKANVPSMTLSAGSVITVRNRERSREEVRRNLELAQSREVPSWMTMDTSSFTGAYTRIPTRDEIAPIVDEQLVVELYSK
jgi:small subunit ribosomal protein S4